MAGWAWKAPLGARLAKGRVAPYGALAVEATMGQPTPATPTAMGQWLSC